MLDPVQARMEPHQAEHVSNAFARILRVGPITYFLFLFLVLVLVLVLVLLTCT